MKFRTGFFDGWLLSLLVAVLIAGCTLLIMSNARGFDRGDQIFAGVTVFWSSFLVVMLFMELVVVREARRIIQLTRKKRKKKDDDNDELQVERPGLFNPMRRMYDEVFSFTTTKEQEIEELQKSENFRREFVANISHELKTPLFAAQGFIHTLVDGADEDQKVRRSFLQKAARSLDELDLLVKDILQLSQIESGEIRMKMEPVDMVALCGTIAEKHRSAAGKKSITLNLVQPKKPVVAIADRKWIAQVIINLVSNAINYNYAGGTVTVRFRVLRKWVEVRIADTGEGIPQRHLNRIFERFYRVDKSRSKEYGGTGLGLAIVKHILERHGSHAEVRSDTGKGSEFSFRLEKAKID